MPADKGFLIQDLELNGVSVNISPFLNNETFTESEARATKAIVNVEFMLRGQMLDLMI